jgi:glycosyltransferase involved in cell wall biosynthesis
VLLDLSRTFGAARLILKLRTIFAGLRPDIVHIQYMAPGLLPIVAARLAGISNIIATVHQPATPYGRLPRLFLRTGAMLCQRFVCVSEAVEKSWFGERRCGLLPVDCGLKGEAEGKESVEAGQEHSWRHLTIHNAVDTESIDRILATTDCDGLRRELGLEGVMIVGTIARLSHEKGVDILIKAFVSVHRSNPAARLLIVGDGQERASLIQLSRDLGLESDVVWAGSQTWERAMQHLSLMDVVVVPSRYEGFGLTAIEAMSCAKPVVAFNHDSLAEVLGTGTPGSLVSAGDIKAMSASIAALLTDYDLSASAGRSNRERTEQLFGFDLFQHRVQSLYHSLSTTHHSP